MQTAMSKPCIVNILLANQREVNKNKVKELNNLCFCSFCTGPNILQYILLYNWITIHVSVQQSQRKNFKSVTAVSSEQTLLPFDWSPLLPPLPLTKARVQLTEHATLTFPLFLKQSADHLNGKINLRDKNSIHNLKLVLSPKTRKRKRSNVRI